MKRYLSIMIAMLLCLILSTAEMFAAAPLIQARYVAFTNVADVSARVNWLNGNGARRIVVISTDNTWEAPANGTDYTAGVDNTLGQANQIGGSNDFVISAVFGTTRSVDISDLAIGTTYYIRVYEYNGTGANTEYCTGSGTNNPRWFTTVLAAPTILAATSVGNDNFTINWNAVSGADSYELDISTANAGGFNAGMLTAYTDLDIASDTTSFDVSGLDPSFTYYYRLRAVKGNSTSASSLIAFQATIANSLPTVAAQASVTFTEGTPVAVDAALVVADADNVGDDFDYITGGTVTITDAFAGDVLSATGNDDISVNWVSPTLTLSGTASVESYQEVLRTVTFNNPSDNPDNYGTDLTRTVRFNITDEHAGASANEDVTVNVDDVNDATVIAGNDNTPSFTENGSAVLIDNALTFTDADDDDYNGGNLTVSITSAEANDGLGLAADNMYRNNGGTIQYDVDNDGLWDGSEVAIGTVDGTNNGTNGSLTINLNANATVAIAEGLAEHIAFVSTADKFTSTTRTINFVLTDRAAGNTRDAGVASNTAAITLTIVPQNDAPVMVAGSANFTTITEDETSNSGVLVSDLIGTSFTDVDFVTPNLATDAGIAIIAESGSADVEYSINGGTNWFDVAVTGVNDALILYADANTRLRVVPDGQNGANINDVITYHLYDRSNDGSYTNASTQDLTGLLDANPVTEPFSTGTATPDIVITSVNDAPVLVATAVDLTTVVEDNWNNAGNLVSDILDVSVTDVDAGAIEGIAVVAIANGSGATWQYSINGGASWGNIGVVSETSALLLRPTDKIRISPTSHYNDIDGDANYITFRAWDQSNYSNPTVMEGVKVNVSTNGLATAYSSATDVVNVIISAQNDAPLMDVSKVTDFADIVEDVASGSNPGKTVLQLLTGTEGCAQTDNDILDVDANEVVIPVLQGIAIHTTNLQVAGTWEYSVDAGNNWSAFPVVAQNNALLLRAEDKVRFVPAANAFGTGNYIAYYAWDQTGGTFGDEGTTADATSRGGSTAFSTQDAASYITVTSVDDPPYASNLDGNSVNYFENVQVILDASTDAVVNDVDTGTLNWEGCQIKVTMTAGEEANDDLNLSTGGSVSVTAGTPNQVFVSGVLVGTYPASGAGSGLNTEDLIITLNANSTQVRMNALVRALAYSATDVDLHAQLTKTVKISFSNSNVTVWSADHTITVNVLDRNDQPNFTLTGNQTVDEDAGLQTVNGFYTFNNWGGNGTYNYETNAVSAFTVTNSNNGLFAVQPAISGTGAAAGDLTYTPALNASGSAVVTVTLQDDGGVANAGSDTRQVLFTITVNPVNDNPVLATTIAANTWTEVDGNTVIVNDQVGVTDVDNANMASATATITNFVTNDVLDVDVTGTSITKSYNAGTGVLTLSGSDTKANYQQVLRTLTFDHTGDDVYDRLNGNNNVARTVRTVINDGQAQNNLSNELDQIVNVTNVNDVPALASVDGAPTFTENGTAVAVDANMTLTDVDDLYMDAASVTITDFLAGDVLTFTDNADVTGSYNPATGVLTVTLVGGTATKADVISFFRSVQYSSISEDPTDLANGNNDNTRTIRFAVNDGENASNNLDEIVNITAVNDAPTISVVDGSYLENDGATVIDGTATVTNPEGDWDTGTLTISITSPNATEDITILDEGPGVGKIDIVGPNINDNITTFATFAGGHDGSNLVVTFNNNATTALVQKLVQRFQYSDVSNNNPDPSRSLTFTLVDAGALTGSDNSTLVVISASNDAPTVANVEGGALAYTENAAATAITSTLTIADPDDTNIESATIQITSNYFNGQDVLAYTDQNGIVGTWTAGTGTMLLTGSATLANYQTAIRSITYQNTSDDPSTAQRTVTFIVNDGTDPSTGVTRNINVTAVNDAPVLAVANNFTSVTEDDTAPAGNTVASLIAGQITDPDGPDAGIVITGKTGNGTWEYTTNAGGLWTAIGAVAPDGGLFLSDDANNSIRFVPNPAVNNAQTATLTFQAADDNSGVLNGSVGHNATINGGSTDFSTASATASISVTAVNDAPVWTDGNKGAFASILEDNTNSTGTLVSTLIGTAISDVDNAAQAGVAITSVDNANGTWQYTTDGSAWNAIAPVGAGSSLLLTNDANRAIRFVPAANYNGTATITLVAWDRTSGAEGNKVNEAYSATSAFSSASGTFSITVTAVNDNPTLDNLSVLNINEDAGLQTVNLAGISEGPANEAAGQTIVVTATSDNLSLIPNPTVVYTPDNATGSIEFTPVANANGSAIVTVTVTDDGGTANGGVNTISKTFTVNVAAVNDAPTLTTVSTLAGGTEDQTYTVTYAALAAAADEADIDGPAPTQFRIEAVSTGTLTKNGNPIVAGTTTLTTAEQLVWTPVANANGDINAFTVVAYDGTLPSAPAIQVVVNVAAVNDAPVLTTINTANFTNINEDNANPAGNTIADILNTGVTDVDASAVEGMAIYAANNANGQWQYSLNGGANWTNINSVSSSNALLLGADAGQLIRFLPNPNYSGFSSITYYAWDQSVGAQTTTTSVSTRGGTTAFSTQGTTASITVNPINDPPTFAAMVAETLCVDNGLRTYAISGTTGVGESAQNQVISTITATSDNQVLIPDGSISVTGLSTDGSGNWSATLNYTPAAGQSGSATISITAVDDGGNVPDNDDTETATLSVVVNPIPVITVVDANPTVTYPATVDLSAAGIHTSTNATTTEYYPTMADAIAGTNQIGSPVISDVNNTGDYYIKAINSCGYDIEQINVTISPKVLTYTLSADNKVYDGNTNGTGTITLTNAELGDVVTASGTFTFTDEDVANNIPVNVTAIALAGGDASNYSIDATAATTANITQLALTYTITGNNKVYDGNTNGTGTITLTNVVGLDAVTASGTFTFTDEDVANNIPVDVTGIALAGLDAGNYSIDATSATTANITPLALTYTVTGNNKVYDGNTNGTGTITLTNVVGLDAVTASATFTFTDANVANNIPVNVTGIALAGIDAVNYSIDATAATTANITPLDITVTVDAGQNKVYGATEPLPYTYSYAPALIGLDAFTGGLARIPGEDVGNYPILQGTLALSSNYTITFVGNNFAITPAELTITADNKSKTYGDANPAFTVTYSGFQNGDDEFDLDVLPNATSAAVANSPVGTYNIVPAGAADANYTFNYVNGTLTVNKKTLQAAAFNANKTYGAANPGFTIGYTGFILGENELVIDVLPTATTTATVLSPVGTYPISVAGGSDDNYDFTYVPGTLTVNKATLTVDADDKSKTYGTADPAFTVSFTGFQNGEVLGTSGVTGSASVTRDGGENAGTYTITPALGTLAATNYDFAFTTGTLTINKADQTITFNALPAKTTADVDFNPGATASSGLTVSYSSDNLAVATIVGGNIHIVGAGSATITASQAGDGNYNPALSVDQTLTVTSVTSPVITGDPANTTQCATGSASFSVTSVAGAPVPTLEWQVSTDNGGSWLAVAGGDYTGQGTITLNVSNLTGKDGYQYKLVATNNQGSDESAAATLTVTAPSTPTVAVVSNDIDNTFCSGTNVTFTASPNNIGGGIVAYQWKKNGSNVGLNQNTYSANDLLNGDVISCEITVVGGCVTTTTALSNDITNTVYATTAVNTHPNPVAVNAGQTANFSVTATGANLTYQWRKNNVDLVEGGDIVGSTTSDLIINNCDAGDAGNYDCVVTGSCGSATSNTAALSVTVPPTKLTLQAVGTQTSGVAFNVVVETRDNSNTLQPVTSNTAVTFTVATGTGTLTGSGTITSGNSSATISVTYTKVSGETGVSLTASATGLTSATTNTFNVNAAEPTTQAANINWTNWTKNEISFTWKPGSGPGTLVLAKKNATSIADVPTDFVNYTANPVYGTLGTGIGTSFVVYKGTDSTLTVTGLDSNTRYCFRLFSYNGTGTLSNFSTSLLGTYVQRNKYTLLKDGVNSEIANVVLNSSNVTPNPAKESAVVTIELSERTQVSVLVFDAAGRKVLSAADGLTLDAGTHNIKLDLNNISNGAYGVLIGAGDEVIYHNLMISK